MCLKICGPKYPHLLHPLIPSPSYPSRSMTEQIPAAAPRRVCAPPSRATARPRPCRSPSRCCGLGACGQHQLNPSPTKKARTFNGVAPHEQSRSHGGGSRVPAERPPRRPLPLHRPGPPRRSPPRPPAQARRPHQQSKVKGVRVFINQQASLLAYATTPSRRKRQAEQIPGSGSSACGHCRVLQ